MQTGPKRLPNVIVVMGVAGAGKTLVGKTLARAIGWAFYDADDFHSRANIEKMSRGEPLTDDDRRPWLAAMRATIAGVIERADHGVLACSALKRSYRDIIIGDRPDVRLVYLKGSPDLIHRRLAARHGHFMPPSLLGSQVASLEEPTPDEHPITVDVAGAPTDIVAEIVRRLSDPEEHDQAASISG